MMFMKINFVDIMRHLMIYAMTLQLYQSLSSSSFLTCGQAGRIDHHCMHSLCEQKMDAVYMTWGLYAAAFNDSLFYYIKLTF